MAEGQNIFRLLVYVIIALLLLFIFFTFFAPQFLWREEPSEMIKHTLGRAETDLGHYNSGETRFPEEFTVKAEGYESGGRSLVFECNSEVLCCPQGKDCAGKKAIEWDNTGEERFFSFRKDKPVEISSRCREEEIYICKVFIGEQPAQVKISSFEVSDTELDLTEKNWLKVKYKVENIGKQHMIGVQGIARLYKIKKLPFGLEPEKEIVAEFRDKLFALETGEEIESEIEITIEGNGDYLLEFISFEKNDETNYETKSIEIKASGIVEIGKCIPGETESEYYSEEECRYFFPCEDCKSLLECERKWRKQYKIPEEFEFELWKYDEINKVSKLKLPGETREECVRHCYPEFEIIEEISGFETPLDIVFVIDASGSMSDDIEEVKSVIETVYTKIGEECKTQESGEPCIKIGLYLFEGAFRECYEKPSNPFYSMCIQREKTKVNFPYDSYYYVVCDTIQMNLMNIYKTNCMPVTNTINSNICSRIESELQGVERKNPAEFLPPQCISEATEFRPAIIGALHGQNSDIGFIPITNEMEKLTDALDKIVATQGAEAWSDALYFVLSSNEINWRENSEKAIILITDTMNNTQATIGNQGAVKTLQETALLAQEKNTRIFGLEAAGCDSASPLIDNATINTLRGDYGLLGGNKTFGFACPGTDLQYISSQTSAVSFNYDSASELPEKILEIITEQVKKSTEEFGLRICKEGENPETCSEKCVLPWIEECTECSCVHYYDKKVEDYAFMEILFVVDASQSMQSAIDSMKTGIPQVISAVQEKCKEAGIENCMRVSARQVFGSADSTELLKLTDNTSKAENTIAGIIPGNGGEKDPWAGETLLSLWTDNWQPESKKMIFIITDSANNAEQIVSDDYISMIEANEREEMDKAIVELGDFSQKNNFKIFGFSKQNEEAKSEFEWLAKKTKGETINFSEGENFPVAIGQILLNEIMEETEKQKCLDAQCETCAGLNVETSSVPLEWNYRYMCSHKTDECKLFLSCYSSPHNIALSECEKKWGSKIPGKITEEFELKQDTENNWLYIEGTKFFEGKETTEDNWDECELPELEKGCGGARFEFEEMPEGVESHETEVIIENEEEKEEKKETEYEEEPENEAEKEEPKPADESELECLSGLDCYCETGNDEFEYLERIKESKTPIDLLVVMDATRSMYQEGTEFSEAFSELSDKMQDSCTVNGEPCLRIGMLAVAGFASTTKTDLSFRELENSPRSLAGSLGSLYLSSEPNVMQTASGAISGIGYREEDEPWLDALSYAAKPENAEFVGWRENSQKIILLITSENDKVSEKNTSDVSAELLSQNIQFYGAVKNLAVGSDNPIEQANQLNGKIFEYQTTTHDDSGRLWFDAENKPFTDILKMVLKDSVENEFLNEQRKIFCTEEQCRSACDLTETSETQGQDDAVFEPIEEPESTVNTPDCLDSGPPIVIDEVSITPQNPSLTDSVTCKILMHGGTGENVSYKATFKKNGREVFTGETFASCTYNGALLTIAPCKMDGPGTYTCHAVVSDETDSIAEAESAPVEVK